MLDGYWQNRPSELVKAEILGDWMAGLEAFTEDEIRTACREWVSANPRKKPNVGDVRGIVLASRQKAVTELPSIPEPERDRVSPEAAAEIMRRAGFRPKSA